MADLAQKPLKPGKKNHQGEGGGPPAKYKTPEELQIAIDKYFIDGVSLKKIVTGPPNKREIEEIAIPSICELALNLGFADRQSLRDYALKNSRFAFVIKNAIGRLEAWNEVNLLANSSIGSIFWLKNHGWADIQKLEIATLSPILIKHQGGS
jgi:hypothetical protein